MKILRVSADNFKLCEDNFTISFVPKANKTEYDKEFELHEVDNNLFAFNTLCVIGKNASGKTTVMELLSLVYDIFSNFRIKNSLKVFKFNNKVIKLDVCFYHEKYLYRYMTELYKDEDSMDNIILFKNQRLFKREYRKSYSNSLFDFEKYEEVINENELPLDTSIIYTVLKRIFIRGIYYPSGDVRLISYSTVFNLYKLFDSDLKIVSSILRMFDEHLDSIKMIDENKYEVVFADKKIKEVSDMELYEILSSGTAKGFGLFTFVCFSLKSGSDLVIDEVENHFHKTLVENLVNLYKDKSVNKKNATLIFTTHYCELLDLFGRSDNIYISKYDDKIRLENMYEKYKFRPELSKSNKFYKNAFNTDVNYESLMDFKRELM